MSSQAKETMKMAKKLKSKRVQLVPELVKSTSYAIHREVVELDLEAQKSGIILCFSVHSHILLIETIVLCYHY
jgi:hypothetical protein